METTLKKTDIKQDRYKVGHNASQIGRKANQSFSLIDRLTIDRGAVESMIEDIRFISFANHLTSDADDEGGHLESAVMVRLGAELTEQISRSFELAGVSDEGKAREVARDFLGKLPDISYLLNSDLAAAFDGDPAASSYAEIIVSYPGLYAITAQRIGHVLYELSVPVLPRLITEIAHSKTGIDIHPGAKIGERFFIDHGTGIVIGETATIGKNVKLYQGVKLGAITTRKGQQLKGSKRHPSVGNDVTIYANATVLGGDTFIGDGSTLAGGVVTTESVQPNSKIYHNK